jgi:hypothetical protein
MAVIGINVKAASSCFIIRIVRLIFPTASRRKPLLKSPYLDALIASPVHAQTA